MTWDTLAIGDFCRTGSGGTPSRKKASRYFGGNIPWVKSGELREGVITETEETITELAVLESSTKFIPKGALLVAMYGATIGRVAKLGIDATSNQAVCHILPDESLADIQYMFHALKAQVPHWLGKGVGGAQPNISQDIIKNTLIPLPPLEEQRRIAAMLDQCTILNASQELHLSKMRELEGGLLHQLDDEVQGESTTVALSTLTESGDKINYGVVQPGVHVDAGVPLIRVGDLAAGTVNRSALKSIDPSIESLYSRSRIRGNEILISCVGSIGLIAEVCPEDVGSNIARAVARVPVSKDVNRTWLAAYLRSRKVQRYFTNELRTVSQPTLNIKQIEETEITLPPLGRQQAFAIRLEMVQQKCAQRVRSLQTVRQLANALATQVFSGGD